MSELSVTGGTEGTLPVGDTGRQNSGRYGVWCLVATEAALFAYLLFSYFYTQALSHGAWPPGGPPSLRLAAPNTVILLASSVAVWWGEGGARRGARGRLIAGLALALVLGGVFFGVQLLEWHGKSFGFSTHLYGALYFTTTGFHLAHVGAGLLILLALLIWSTLGYFGPRRHGAVSIGAIYWHFVDAIWLAVFTTYYLSPHVA